MKTLLRHIFITTLVLLANAAPMHAQTSTNGPGMDSLSSLPESEVIVRVNASRILNDALPRLLPEKELQELRSGMDQVKAFTNIDLRNLEFIALVLRFNKPSGGNVYPLPEAMLVVRGDFDVRALLNMGMMMAAGKLREEQYGDHKINLLKLSDVSKDAAMNPYGAAFSEIALTALDPSTLAVGNTSYIKAALDAADGRGRINPKTIDSLMRSPDALISTAGSPLMAFASSFALRMAKDRESNASEQHFGDYYVALNMDPTNFKITGTLFADNPETAGIIKNMLVGLLDQTKSAGADKDMQAITKQMNLIAEGSEVTLQAIIPQETAAKFFREMFAPKPPPKPAVVDATMVSPTITAEKPPVKPKKKVRRSRRKT